MPRVGGEIMVSEAALAQLDTEIASLELELQRKREVRQGMALILGLASPASVPEPALAITGAGGKRLTAKQLLVRELERAGGPLPWSELQRLVSNVQNAPGAGALASAFYHNTKSGTRTFLALGNGYAGLSGRDEGWDRDRAEGQAKLVLVNEETDNPHAV